ncbi:unnamed protein product [Cylicostephanus goldi]|uniref:Protein-tyrosine-phosphatase n=1 Tax=Cylicostephanus goldi TaxID=71465 RepID=A0A3P6QAM0_CYLGO|nr:unnamed protein product [Cylicostephanus goldi]
MVKNGQRLFVKHHRWKTWPDKTVPKSLLAVFRILQVVRGTSRPIVIHCSAGIGRTGSVVAIEMGLQTLLAGQKLNLLDVCRKIRDQRMHSVQVEVQYVYVAEALCEYGKAMEYWKDPELLQMFTKFKASFDDYVSKLPVLGQAPAQAYSPAASHPGVPLNAPPPLIAASATPPQSPAPDVLQALRQPPPMVANGKIQ